MKTNIITNNTIMKTYIKYLCAVLLVVGTSARVWGADPSAPSANYTLIKDVASLSTNDRVILYCPANSTAVSGLSTCNSSTEAGMSSSTQMWVEYKVAKSSTTITLQDTRLSSNNYVYNNSSKFQYSSSATALSITSSGIINAGGTNLNAKTVGTGSCERASARFASGGSPIYVFKVVTPKESKYSVSVSSAELSITIDDDEGESGGYYYSSGKLVQVTTTASFVGGIYGELFGFSSPDVTSEEIYLTNSDDATNGYITNEASDVNGVYIKSWSLGSDGLTNGSYQGYIHVYPNSGSNTTDEFYIPLTITVVNGNDGCTPNDINLTDSGSKTNGSFSTSPASEECEGETVTISASPNTGYEPDTWTVLDGNADQVSLSGSGNTRTFTMPNSDVEVDVTFRAKSYTVTLDREGSTTGATSITVTYNSSTVTGFTAPEKEGYTFGGYYTGDNGTGTQVLSTTGVLQASVTGYTGLGGIWTKTTATTLYAKWTVHSNTLTLGSPTTVTISSSTPTLAEGEYTNVNYGSTVTLAYSSLVDGREWGGWKVTKDADGTDVTASVVSTNTLTMPDYAITVTANTYGSFAFSCADWAVTGPSRDTVFITSTASTKVRSQEAFHVTASGLPASTALTFATFPTNTRFEFKKADGTAIETDEYGKVNTDFYIFYTPTSGDTSDGLDEITKIYVSVNGEPRKDTLDTKVIYGRHLPEKFVIAAKRDGKWLALPSNMASTSTPSPVEIAVDHADNPTIAYTAATNTYSLYDQAAGEYIKLAMNGQSDAPLYGSGSTAPIGKSGNAIITNTLNDDGYFWKLVQSRATGLSNAKQAKYTIYCKNNSTNHLRLKENSGNPIWGLYDSGIEELRLIPASTVGPTEAYFVEWAQHGGVIEVNAEGVGATKVQAVLNGTESAIKSLTQTCTSVKNRASIYNYTLNFNDVGHVIDLAASTSNGAMLTLRWLDNSEDLVAVSNITVPKIVATSTTMSAINSGDDPWLQMEAHVLPGVTLTANAGDFKSNDVTIKHLEIYPGATVVVTKGEAGSGTLTTKTLVLRNGWSRAGEKTYDVARLYVTPSTATLKATNVYADWYIDYDQYYPIAVPWNATVANFDYRYCTVSSTVGPEANIRLRYYDGNSRATNVQEGVGSGANWKAYGEGSNLAVPSALLPSHGYIMTAKRPSGKAFSIIRMPLTLPSGTWADGSWTTSGESGSVSTTHKDEIAVTAHNSGSTPGYAQGWNLIANPYMALHQGALTYNDDSGDEIEYANVPDINFTEYDQLPIATTKLKPSSAFLVQAPKDGTVTFGTANRKASAPSSYRNEAPKASKQKAYILLNGNEAEDQMGIIIGEQYTAAYELNADLEKLLSDGTSLRTYMRYGDRNMAYVAINAELAKELIPVTVRIPANGEYVFSLHEASIAGELEGIYLTDYLTGTTTNLLYDSYMFTAEAGTNAERFAINAIVGERKTPTGVDIPGVDKNGTEPVKFIWHDKVYILHNNVIYDSTGKRVNVINK